MNCRTSSVKSFVALSQIKVQWGALWSAYARLTSRDSEVGVMLE